MIHYLFRSRYRFAILGICSALAGLWYAWYRTDQIMSISPLLYASFLVIMNLFLAYYASTRHTIITRYLFLFSYAIIVLVTYNLVILVRGITL